MHTLLKPVLLIFTIALLFLSACSTDEEATILGDTSRIELYAPEDEESVYDDIRFEYSEYYSEYIIIMIFSEEIYTDADNNIANWDKCLGGIHTGMSGFMRGSASLTDMRSYDQNEKDFTGDALELEEGVSYYWAAIGLNSDLTSIDESSPSYLFTYVERPIFEIKLSYPSDNSDQSGNIEFTYSLDDYASSYMLALFESDISYSANPFSINWEECVAGIETGMPYFYSSYTYLEDFHPYSESLDGFDADESFELSDASTYYWIVLGFNSDKSEVVSASDPRRFIYHRNQQ